MDKRERIIHAAIEVFRENGIEKTKISDIVKKAQIAQGTFYLYFPSKLSVMPAIAEKMAARMEEAIRQSVNTENIWTGQLREMIGAVFTVTDEYRDVSTLVYAGLSATEHVREWEEIYRPLYMTVSSMIEEWELQGEIRETDPHRTARLIIGLAESAAEQIYLFDSFDAAEERKQQEAVNEFVIHALRK
ncbi:MULTISPECIES: TetR family transcriptional regulator [Bhargavaea]|uniref:TetR family transcriptional regulator n=1 Tax=Bhargavaea changchunensis TaxID=2134037 RepID=A0ABW2NEX0_9BACL|nr:TetR family transcriptional regulator [Bhargavaea sp. CC-171006]